MILIGQFDSPFVRRVGVALAWYGRAFEHRAHAVFRDEALIAQFNPLRKVPTLVLDDGTVLTESFVCLDYIDEWAASEYGNDWDRLLLPRDGAARLDGMRLSGFAVGAMDKLVTLIYARHVNGGGEPNWIERCTRQVSDTMSYLERVRGERSSEYLLGTRLSHADIAITCAITLAGEALPDVLTSMHIPALAAHTEKCEALPEFRSAYQPFIINR